MVLQYPGVRYRKLSERYMDKLPAEQQAKFIALAAGITCHQYLRNFLPTSACNFSGVSIYKRPLQAILFATFSVFLLGKGKPFVHIVLTFLVLTSTRRIEHNKKRLVRSIEITNSTENFC